jgi:succinate dehydrogenase / fumarate reductase, cytochrome b subunit
VAKRPVNLDLSTFQFPVTAIASILHRISGFILFLLIPLILWVFSYSLTSPEHFQALQAKFAHPLSKIIFLSIFLALFYHLLAGVRHLIMDTGWGEKLAQARCSARVIILLAVMATMAMGVYWW